MSPGAVIELAALMGRLAALCIVGNGLPEGSPAQTHLDGEAARPGQARVEHAAGARRSGARRGSGSPADEIGGFRLILR